MNARMMMIKRLQLQEVIQGNREERDLPPLEKEEEEQIIDQHLRRQAKFAALHSLDESNE